MDGLEVCRQLKADPSLPFMPIILVTARADTKDIVAGLDAGADEYLTKPVDQAALVARVRSILRIKALHDTVQAAGGQELERNGTGRSSSASRQQLAEIERMGRAQAVPFAADRRAHPVRGRRPRAREPSPRDRRRVLRPARLHRASPRRAEPEEVMAILREYHEALGELIHPLRGHARAVRRATDVVVLFNDPLPCPDPAARAVRMAVEMRARVAELAAELAQAAATSSASASASPRATPRSGRIGFDGRFDYAAIGTVVNLAARLCDEAADGQILISQRALAAVEGLVETEPAGELALKGFARPVTACRILRLRAHEACPGLLESSP